MAIGCRTALAAWNLSSQIVAVHILYLVERLRYSVEAQIQRGLTLGLKEVGVVCNLLLALRTQSSQVVRAQIILC